MNDNQVSVHLGRRKGPRPPQTTIKRKQNDYDGYRISWRDLLPRGLSNPQRADRRWRSTKGQKTRRILRPSLPPRSQPTALGWVVVKSGKLLNEVRHTQPQFVPPSSRFILFHYLVQPLGSQYIWTWPYLFQYSPSGVIRHSTPTSTQYDCMASTFHRQTPKAKMTEFSYLACTKYAFHSCLCSMSWNIYKKKKMHYCKLKFLQIYSS